MHRVISHCSQESPPWFSCPSARLFHLLAARWNFISAVDTNIPGKDHAKIFLDVCSLREQKFKEQIFRRCRRKRERGYMRNISRASKVVKMTQKWNYGDNFRTGPSKHNAKSRYAHCHGTVMMRLCVTGSHIRSKVSSALSALSHTMQAEWICMRPRPKWFQLTWWFELHW